MTRGDRLVLFGVIGVLLYAFLCAAVETSREGVEQAESATATQDETEPLERLPACPFGRHPEPFAPRPCPALSEEEARAAGLSPREAAWWEPLGDGRVRCGLCPRRCVLKPGERGACRVRANYGGKLVTLVFGHVAAFHDDAIEKKPLNHFLPGTTALSIATPGCNLGCIFCQNWAISQAYPEKCPAEPKIRGLCHACRRAREERPELARIAPKLLAKRDFSRLDPEEVVELARAVGADSVAYTYTEPTVFYEYMLETARAARKAGLKNVWVTCGFIEEKPLRELCRYLDAANVDLKGFSEDFYRRYCGAALAPVLRTLKILKEEGVWVEVTNLVIPGANDDERMIRSMCRWLKKNLGAETPLFFSRFRPAYKLTDRPMTPVKTLKKAAKIAREEGMKFVYVGNVLEPEVTFCPDCGARLIVRTPPSVWEPGWRVENHLENGRCPECGRLIPGVWSK